SPAADRPAGGTDRRWPPGWPRRIVHSCPACQLVFQGLVQAAGPAGPMSRTWAPAGCASAFAYRGRRIGIDMKVYGRRWLGIATDQPVAMIGFLRDTLGLRVEVAERTTTELSLRNGDRVQVFAPGNAYHDQYRSQGVVPLFELDDVHAARHELEEA